LTRKKVWTGREFAIIKGGGGGGGGGWGGGGGGVLDRPYTNEKGSTKISLQENIQAESSSNLPDLSKFFSKRKGGGAKKKALESR